MTRRIVPMTDRILVRPLAAAPRKSGGLAVPDAQQEEPTEGVVVAVGPDAVHNRYAGDGTLFKKLDGVEVGWIVIWRQFAGFEQIVNGETFRMLRMEEIEGRVVEE